MSLPYSVLCGRSLPLVGRWYYRTGEVGSSSIVTCPGTFDEGVHGRTVGKGVVGSSPGHLGDVFIPPRNHRVREYPGPDHDPTPGPLPTRQGEPESRVVGSPSTTHYACGPNCARSPPPPPTRSGTPWTSTNLGRLEVPPDVHPVRGWVVRSRRPSRLSRSVPGHYPRSSGLSRSR